MGLNFPTPVFNHKVHLCKGFLNLFRIRSFFINFVDRKNNRHTSCLSMTNSFFGLRHNIIIRSNYNNCNIRYLSSTSTHRRKGFVTRSIQECYFLFILKYYRICSDMLSNTSRFSCNYIFASNMI